MPDPYITGDPNDPTQPWYVRHRFRALVLTALIPVVVGMAGFVGVVAVVQHGLKGHAVYAQALEAVRSDARVGAELGTPLEPGFSVWGTAGGEDAPAEMMFSVTGPTGSAGVRVMGRPDANADAGWRVTFLDVGTKSDTTGRSKIIKLVTEEDPQRFADEAERME